MKREDLKILLLQIRQDLPTCEEEHFSFAKFADIAPEQIRLFNPFLQSHFHPDIVDQFDALFVGGSSDATVLNLKHFPFIKDCKRLMRYCYDQCIPVFASCFGFQIAVEAFGGKVILDRANSEVGLFELELTAAGKEDILFHDTPSPFWAVSGHKERAERLPEGALLLTHSELCPYHAFKFPDKPFYAFQFHPEISCKVLHDRLQRYSDRYLDGPSQLQQIIEDSTHETPESNLLVKKYVDRVLL